MGETCSRRRRVELFHHQKGERVRLGFPYDLRVLNGDLDEDVVIDPLGTADDGNPLVLIASPLRHIDFLDLKMVRREARIGIERLLHRRLDGTADISVLTR